MFTKKQETRIREIIKARDMRPRVYTKEELSWRYAVWNNDRVVGIKDIRGRIIKEENYFENRNKQTN